MDFYFEDNQNDPIFDKTFSVLENLKTDDQEGCNLLDLVTDVSSPETFSVEKEEKKYFNGKPVPKTIKQEKTDTLDFTSFFKDDEKVVEKKNITKEKNTTKNQQMMYQQKQPIQVNMVKQQQQQQPVFQQPMTQGYFPNPYMNFYNFQGRPQMIPNQNLYFQQMMNYQKGVMVNNNKKNDNGLTTTTRKRKRSPINTESNIPFENNNNTVIDDKDDKELKRKKRLIKNRQSAQASRERKKMYVKGLEKSVNDLTSEKITLTSQVTDLEKENILLRMKLKQALEGNKDVGPLPKKRKYEHQKVETPKKVPIPAQGLYGMKIPFLQPVFWNNFFAGGQTDNMNKSPRVILFIALFCIALFFFPNLLNKAHTEQRKVRIANRVLLHSMNNNINERFMKNLKPDIREYFVDKINALQNEIGSLKVKANDTDYTLAQDELKSKINDILGDVKLDWKDDNVEFIFPTSKKANTPVVINGKKIKSEQTEEKTGKIIISKEFLTEICDQLGESTENK